MWDAFRLVQFTGGLFLGALRTQAGEQDYQPARLGVPHHAHPRELQAIVIRVPGATPFDPDLSTRLLLALWQLGRFLVQIVADQQGIAFRVVMIDGVPAERVLNVLAAYYPAGQLEIHPYLRPAAALSPVSVARLTLPLIPVHLFPAPLPVMAQLKQFDPLIAFTHSVGQLRHAERIVYTVAVVEETQAAAEAGYQLITTSGLDPLAYTSLPGIMAAEQLKAQGLDRVPKFEHSLQQVMEAKLQNPLFHCLIFLQVEAATPPQVEQLVQTTLPHLLQFTNPPFNALSLPGSEALIERSRVAPDTDLQSDVLRFVHRWLNGADPEVWQTVLAVLQPEEIAALWHLPDQAFTTAALERVTAKQVELPRALRHLERGILLGHNRYGALDQPVYLPDDDRTTHTAIIGKSGTGKSSLLHRLIQTDIGQGKGICVIDPHGQLIEGILRTSIPDGRADDVVILDVATKVDGMYYPPGLNLLARPGGISGELAAGMLSSILTKIYADFAETEMAHTLYMALLTLSPAPDATLLDIPRLFEDEPFRESLLKPSQHLALRRFWQRLLAKSSGQREQMLYPVMRRLDTFYSNNHLLSLTCHPRPLDFAALIRQNKIILVSLAADEATLPELERRLLGAMLITQLQQAAMTGAIQQPPYLLYIDEAQQFVTTALPKMLSEARKSGLGLILANQYFRQLVGDTLNAIEGNVGTLIAFEVGESDARDLALALKPSFAPEDLVNLGKFRAAVSLRVGGSRPPAFSLETLSPPVLDPVVGRERELSLRRRSVAHYTPQAYSEVITWLQQRYAPDTPPNPTHPRALETDDEFIEPHR